MATISTIRSMESIAYERDRQEFALGDTLDIKTGLILAALTFLALQSGDLIKTSASQGQMVLQWLSVFALIVGGIFSVIELWPRDYGREAPPKKYLDWITDTEKYRTDYPDAGVEPVTEEKLTEERVKAAVENVQMNLALNRKKSTFMFFAFACAAASFALNVATLIMHLS